MEYTIITDTVVNFVDKIISSQKDIESGIKEAVNKIYWDLL